MRRLALTLLLTAAGCTSDAPDAPATADSGTAAPGTAESDAPAGTVETRMVRDDSTGVTLPRIVLPERPAVEARINAQLDSLSASLQCDPTLDPPGGGATEYESSAIIATAAHDVFSLNLHSSYNCGGPYPSDGVNQSVTFDLTTGDLVPFDALFRDGADRTALAGLFSAALTPMAGDMNGECDDVLSADALTSATFDYALSDDGLAVQPEFPHVIAACGVEATIPYAAVRAFAREGGVLARVADAQTGG